jgi:hypothetical protein
MAEENKPEDEDLDDVEENEDEDVENEEDQEEEQESGSSALAGLAGAAAAGALAKKGAKKPAKGKAAAKAKKGAKPAAKPTAKPAMPAGTVDVNAEVEKLQKLTDKNTVWTVAGYSFTPAKLMILGTILSTALGGLYGAFEVYKDYQDMKVKIAKYVAPDLSELYKKMELAQQNSEKSVQYTQDIKNDLKQDIRRLENTVEQVERGQKQSSRETMQDVNDLRKELKVLDQGVDKKIQRALDNPLAGK